MFQASWQSARTFHGKRRLRGPKTIKNPSKMPQTKISSNCRPEGICFWGSLWWLVAGCTPCMCHHSLVMLPSPQTSLTGSGITRRMAGGVRSVMFTAASVGQEMYHQCWNVIKGIFPNLSGMLPLHHEIVAALDGTRTEEERFALFGNPCLTRAGIAMPCLSSAEVKEEIQYFRRPLKSAQLWRARP